MNERIGTLIGFHVLIFVLLALDLGVFHRKAHEIKTREALGWSVVWISLAGFFAIWVGFSQGRQQALDFATAYVVEKSLSVDNIFVFVVIFTGLKVPPEARHRVLFWGVIGAILLRGPLIYLGVEALKHFHVLIYVFGGFLVFTGLKIGFGGGDDDDEEEEEEPEDPQKGRLVRFVRWLLPVTEGFRGTSLFVREQGRFWATPLFTTLVIVELSDVIFAVDSIPAVLAVTDDFFVAYTSNIFAILGLRSLFFVVAAGVEKFTFLKPALAFILVFIGVKMILGALDVVKIPPAVSLGVILGVLLLAGLASVRVQKAEAHRIAVEEARQEAPAVHEPPAPGAAPGGTTGAPSA